MLSLQSSLSIPNRTLSRYHRPPVQELSIEDEAFTSDSELVVEPDTTSEFGMYI